MNATDNDTMAAILESAAVYFKIDPAGVGLNRDGWICDGWRVYFFRGQNPQGYARPDKSGNFPKAARETFDYYTGTGHRKPPVKNSPFKSEPRPVPPQIAGVLHSLILDSDAGGLSFSDFCAEFGYSADSLKALNSYRECEESARRIRSIFPAELLAELRDILADY